MHGYAYKPHLKWQLTFKATSFVGETLLYCIALELIVHAHLLATIDVIILTTTMIADASCTN